MIIVTGGLGFIGSNIVHGLNAQGYTDIVVVDDFSDGTKFVNIVEAEIADYWDKEEFLARLRQRDPIMAKVEAIIHQGACSATTEWNGRLVMDNNYEYSKAILHTCLERHISLIYASSAAVYGAGKVFIEEPRHEAPLNVYGYSKTLFDRYARRLMASARSQVVGLRYFNVYGPREQHKGDMASVAYHLHSQLQTGEEIRLFTGCDGYGPGEQKRDFIHVDDVVDVVLWLLDHPGVSGLFNVGTGKSQSFNEVAGAVLKACGRGRIRYIPFPDHLRGRYQSFTEADLTRLRSAGYQGTFRDVESGVGDYMRWLAGTATSDGARGQGG